MSKKGRKTRIKKSRFIPFLIILFVIVIGGIAGINFYLESLEGPYNQGNSDYIEITIPQGASTGLIAEILEEAGVVESAFKFKLYAKLNDYDGKLQAGVYNLSSYQTTKEIADSMLKSKAPTQKMTIPEGYSIKQTANSLVEQGLVDYDAFMEEVVNGSFNYRFMTSLPAGENRLEGFLFPETYEIFTTATEYDIVNKMLSQFDKIFKDEYYDRAKALGLDIYDIITIASIIEREARVDEDRELIASVIYNRLDIGMNLQMCSTVQYILGEPKAVLTTKDTQIDNPYNTYINAGLPPGPICSPGQKSIEAALYPADTDYIYFVVSEKLDGSHNFSSDYNKFLKDKEAYQNAIR